MVFGHSALAAALDFAHEDVANCQAIPKEPHAANLPDLLRAQGFVTAQHRLLQGELFRASWRGELAATFGEAALPSDIRMRVTSTNLQAWIDDERLVNVGTKDRKISIRWECEPCKPFGFATWSTTGAVRKIRVRRLDEK